MAARRVLWVVKGLGPGGAERLLVAAAGATERARFSIECAYVLPWKDHLAGELERAGVRTSCLSRVRRDPLWPVRLVRLVRSGGWDVVHVHSPLPGSVARIAARSMPEDRRPGVVSTEHNQWGTHAMGTRVLERWTSRWDTTTFAVTDEVRGSMSGAAADRAVTLRHGIDVERVAAARVERAGVRSELGLAEDELVVGTVANYRPQKDYPTLLRAVRELADRGVRMSLVAVGQGPQAAEIEALVDELDIRDRVVLTGFRPDAVRVMAGCDVFTLASGWEGLPVALMEALALGLPVVATAVGGVAEELRDGLDALLVPPHDPVALASALEQVLTDSELRRALAAASRARAVEYDARRATEVIERAYGQAARAEPPVPAPAPSAARRSGGRAEPAAPDVAVRRAVDADREDILRLLVRSLGAEGDDRYAALFAWKHDRNPFGPSPMWVATIDGRVTAFRTLMRWEFVRGGSVVRAVRAVDTATDPEFQGLGLFRRLTLHALDEVRADGVDLVFNTPNSQSRPGYLKMGWRDVGYVPAAVRFTSAAGAVRSARSRVPADRWSQPLAVGERFDEWLDRQDDHRWSTTARDVRELRTNRSRAFLAWRYGGDLLGYRAVEDGTTAVVCRARRRGRALELAVVDAFGDPRASDRLAAAAARTAGADYVVRLGPPSARGAYVPLPGGGPALTWRDVCDPGPPPLSNWHLTLGDIELF